MLDTTPCSRDSNMIQSELIANFRNFRFSDQREFRMSRAEIPTTPHTTMDSSSPLSPASITSPTDSDHPLTPATPTQKSWGSRKASLQLPLQSSFTARVMQSPIERRSTLHYILPSPKLDSMVEKPTQRRKSSTCILKSATSPYSTTSQQIYNFDSEGDVVMSSPSSISPNRDQWYQAGITSISERLETASSDDIADNFDSSLQSNSASDHYHALRLSSESFTTTTCTTTYTITEPQLKSSQKPSNLLHRRRTKQQKRYIPNPLQTQLKNSISHLATPLVPLISVTNGLPHPHFPRTILQYHLLTHDQLDDLARWYHQTVDNTYERYMYPAVIERAWTWSSSRRMDAIESGATEGSLSLATKRRRFGRFIGLRGCESPIEFEEIEAGVEDDEEGCDDEEKEDEESVERRMEREWRAAMRRAEEEERILEKVWKGRW